jgi:microbial collagenase
MNATGTTDPDGIRSYAWSFGDGATSTSSNPTRTYAAPGEYTITVTATDNWGKVGPPVSQTITVT